MSELPEHKVLFTIASDGSVGMFPSAAAVESALAPSKAENTRIFMEDAGELELQVEVELFMQQIDGLSRQRPRNITTVLMPDAVIKDEDFLRRTLTRRFPDIGVSTASDLSKIVEAVKRNLNYGFH